MPGYKVHDATGTPELMGNLDYRKGLNAPDYFKKIDSEEKFKKYFEDCDETPTYEEFLKLKEVGFHLGYSSNPDIKKFLNLEFVNLAKTFWEGYLIHLIGDKIIYNPENGCVNKEKFERDGSQKEVLHRDWDITNYLLEEEFGIELLPEIKELGIVKYVENEIPVYINAEKLIECVYKIREIASDPEKLEEYIDNI